MRLRDVAPHAGPFVGAPDAGHVGAPGEGREDTVTVVHGGAGGS